VTKKRKFVAGVTNVVGGALVEFEQQIMRGRPRVEKRYLVREQDTASSSDGGKLSIELPEDLAPATAYVPGEEPHQNDDDGAGPVTEPL
jgi:hypothetical protein